MPYGAESCFIENKINQYITWYETRMVYKAAVQILKYVLTLNW